MAQVRPRVFGIVPNASGLASLLRDFSAKGGGMVTGFGDGPLRACSKLAAEFDNLEVLAFGEVIRRSLGFCGETPSAMASGSQLTAAIAQHCTALEPDSPFHASAAFAGFHKAAGRTLKELAAWGIGADALRSAAVSAADHSRAKIEALADLRAGADETLNQLGRELVDSQVLRNMECKVGEGCTLGRILILAGTAHEPLRAQWCRWAAQQGAEIWIAVDAPVEEARLFQGSRLLADQIGAQIEPLGAPSDFCGSLFTARTARSAPKLSIHSCADSYAEAEWALRGCLAEVSGGTLESDLAIYVRNLEEYAPFLSAAAKRLQVKISMSVRAPVLTNQFAKHLLDLLRFCAGDDARQLRGSLRSSYLDLTYEDRKDLSAAVLHAYKAKHNQWPVLRGWAEANMDRAPWLPKLLDWRHDALKEDRQLFDWIGRLGTLGDLLLAGVGQGTPTMVRDSRILPALRRPLSSLASVRRVAGDQPMSLGKFVQLCEQAWRGEEYVVPSSDSGIEIVSSAEALGSVKSLRVLGMLEGVFPRRRSEDAILTDSERRQISSALNLSTPLPDSFSRAREERDEFYRLCSAGQEELIFSYPQTDENRDNVPAFYLREIERVAPSLSKHDFPRVPFGPDIRDALTEADRLLAEAREGEREEPLTVQFKTDEVQQSVAWVEGDGFTPQDLRDTLRCEFRHFVGRQLKLRPPRTSSRWASLSKLPEAAQLARQPTPQEAQHALELQLEVELEDLYGELPEWEMTLLKSGGKRLISEWVAREFKAREIWPRSEVEVGTTFGSSGLRDAMPGGVRLQGNVAAVSKVGPYSVAHLYELQPPKQESHLGGPLEEIDTLYYGLHLLARYTDGPTAIEVDSLSGTRTLMMLPRVAEQPLSSRRQNGLEVVDLSGGNEGGVAKKVFYDEVKKRLRKAVSRLKAGGIEPLPGEHCAWCGFGELCRRAQGYGEDDSPFGVDIDELE